MLKYLAKISMDILPSVLATIIGAYIVNHYINAKPAADIPAAVSAPAQAGSDAKPTDAANLLAPGVKAKGALREERDREGGGRDQAFGGEATSDTKAADTKAADTKAADVTPAETASHGRPAAREKTAAKSTPAAAAVPVVEANSAPAAATPDANDLARAAIERLRKSPEGKAAPRGQIRRYQACRTDIGARGARSRPHAGGAANRHHGTVHDPSVAATDHGVDACTRSLWQWRLLAILHRLGRQ